MTRHIGTFVLAIGGGLVMLFALWGYATPLTGVTGTPGPLLAAAGGGCLVVAAVALSVMAPGGWRVLMHVLVVLALLGCGLCGWLLLSSGIVAGAVVGAAGLFLYLASIGGAERRAFT